MHILIQTKKKPKKNHTWWSTETNAYTSRSKIKHQTLHKQMWKTLCTRCTTECHVLQVLQPAHTWKRRQAYISSHYMCIPGFIRSITPLIKLSACEKGDNGSKATDLLH